jgi:hypothetical protein
MLPVVNFYQLNLIKLTYPLFTPISIKLGVFVASHNLQPSLIETSKVKSLTVDILQLSGQNLGRVFNFRSGNLHAVYSWGYQSKLPNLKLKTRPKQLLGSLPLDIGLPQPNL